MGQECLALRHRGGPSRGGHSLLYGPTLTSVLDYQKTIALTLQTNFSNKANNKAHWRASSCENSEAPRVTRPSVSAQKCLPPSVSPGLQSSLPTPTPPMTDSTPLPTLGLPALPFGCTPVSAMLLTSEGCSSPS